MTVPLLLPPNPVARFYSGGPAIAALRGVEPVADHVPEDWVGSTTEALGEPGVGLSSLPDGTLLRDAIAADPGAWLGSAHVARWGPDPALLVKLLDAGERLPVHFHPSGPFAREHLGTRFGKTEAWIVLAGSGAIHLGWREPVDAGRLRDWIDTQPVEQMLGALHRVELGPGDAVFVPAGVPHAIGQGLLIAELQEPSDMSVMLEWDGYEVGGEHGATLGLGWDTALAAVDRDACDPAPLSGPSAEGPVARLLPEAADPFFRAEAVGTAGAPVELDRGFSVVLVLDGHGSLAAATAEPLSVARGDNVVIPDSAGPVTVAGDVRAIRCRPPDPDTPETEEGR